VEADKSTASDGKATFTIVPSMTTTKTLRHSVASVAHRCRSLRWAGGAAIWSEASTVISA
jgi:hypothetical protein